MMVSKQRSVADLFGSPNSKVKPATETNEVIVPEIPDASLLQTSKNPNYTNGKLGTLSRALLRLKQRTKQRSCDKLYALINGPDLLIKNVAENCAPSSDEGSSEERSMGAAGDEEVAEEDVVTDDSAGVVTMSYEDFIRDFNNSPSQVASDGAAPVGERSPNDIKDDISANVEKKQRVYGSIQRFLNTSEASFRINGNVELLEDEDSQKGNNLDKIETESEKNYDSNVYNISSEQSCCKISSDSESCSNDELSETRLISLTAEDETTTEYEDCCIVAVEGTMKGVSQQISPSPNAVLGGSLKQSSLCFTKINQTVGVADTRVMGDSKKCVKKTIVRNVKRKARITEIEETCETKDKRSVMETEDGGTRTKKHKSSIKHSIRYSNSCDESNKNGIADKLVKKYSREAEKKASQCHDMNYKLVSKKSSKRTVNATDVKSLSKMKKCNSKKDAISNVRRSPRTRQCISNDTVPSENAEKYTISKYNVCSVDTTAKSPLRIKIRRCISGGSIHNQTTVKKTLKVSVMHKILSTARRLSGGSSKRDSSRAVRDKIKARRSRRSHKTSAVTDSLSEMQSGSDNSDIIIVGKTEVKECVKKKTSSIPSNTGSAPIAPLFTSTRRPVEKTIDPDALQRRKAFLMGGGASDVRLPTANASPWPQLPYFTDIPHVRQLGVSDISMDQRPEGLRWESEDSSVVCRHGWCHGLVDLRPDAKLESPTVTRETKDLPQACVDSLINQLHTNNRSFNVMDMYMSLRKRRADSRVVTIRAPDCGHTKDVTVVDDLPEQLKHNGQKRSKLQLKKKLHEIVITPVVSPLCTEQSLHAELLWTDVYKPRSAAEIVGHTRYCRRLKKWLVDWKLSGQRETRRLRRELQRDLHRKQGDGCDSDGEFEGDRANEEEDEESALCNTVVISGPHGVGKTASVYALAEELGYQVFEVNSTSSRNGKKILAQLQEVTQSHQVSKQQLHKSFTASHALQNLSKEPSSPGVDSSTPKMPTAFTNLFKKANDTKPTDSRSPQKIKPLQDKTLKSVKLPETSTKRKRTDSPDKLSRKKKKVPENSGIMADETKSSDSSTCGLNLSNLSLILFDEVDVVFEEDRGFWSSIQSFMASTKRPIILTTADPSFTAKFEGYYEHIVYKSPKTTNVTAYLQLVCLCEGTQTHSADIHRVASLHRNDIRRCLLALQMWVESGGGRISGGLDLDQASHAVNRDEISMFLRDSAISCDSLLGATTDLNRDGVSLFTDNRTRESFSDSHDETRPTAKSVLSASDSVNARLCREVIVKDTDDNAMFIDVRHATCQPTPCHRNSFLSVLGLDRDCEGWLEPAQRRHNITLSARAACHLLSACCHVSPATSCIHLNLHKLIRLPTYSVSAASVWPIKSENERNKPAEQRKFTETGSGGLVNESKEGERSNVERTLIQSIMDSDGSGSEETHEASKQPDRSADTRDGRKIQQIKELSKNTTKPERAAVAGCLDALLVAYDTTSFLDSYMRSRDAATSRRDDCVSVSAGLVDESSVVECAALSESVSGELTCECERLLVSRCGERVEAALRGEAAQSEYVGGNVRVAVMEGESRLQFLAHHHRTPAYDDALCDIHQSLPPMPRNSRILAMDYLPYMRAVCLTEQVRCAAKLKRRFLHYFDGISLNLKENTVNVLCSSFT